MEHRSVQSYKHTQPTPLWAPKHLCAPRVQGHKNIFMRASGHWATAMFAIFSALHDSIQASRLILRAPTVSPSIRNMYNSTACFFLSLSFCFFSVNIHSYYYQPSVKNPSKAKKEDCLLGEQGGGRGVVSGLVRHFYSPRCPKASYTSPMMFDVQGYLQTVTWQDTASWTITNTYSACQLSTCHF